MSRPRLFTPEEIRERRRLRGIEYRKRNREKIRAYKQRPEVRARRKAENRKWRESHPDYHREYYAAHREAFREYRRAWMERWGIKHGVRIVLTNEDRLERTREQHRKWNEKNCERVAATTREWRKRNRDKVNAYARAYAKAHPEYYRARYVLRVLREMVDCEYYARNREKARERAERKRRRDGKPVRRPLLSMRIPDWCVRGMVLDVRSQWLINNLTDSQRAYARELAIERRAR